MEDLGHDDRVLSRLIRSAGPLQPIQTAFAVPHLESRWTDPNVPVKPAALSGAPWKVKVAGPAETLGSSPRAILEQPLQRPKAKSANDCAVLSCQPPSLSSTTDGSSLLLMGYSQVGKTTDFDSVIRRFESYYPIHFHQ